MMWRRTNSGIVGLTGDGMRGNLGGERLCSNTCIYVYICTDVCEDTDLSILFIPCLYFIKTIYHHMKRLISSQSTLN